MNRMVNNLPAFWKQALMYQGSVTPRVFKRGLFFVAYSVVVCFLYNYNKAFHLSLGPLEISGAVIGVILVIRANAGHERWWEARKLWGGIVNQSRNIAISGLSYGPEDVEWRKNFIKWGIVFPYSCMHSLRGERKVEEVHELLTEEEVKAFENSQHLPNFVAKKMSDLLHEARKAKSIDGFAFMQIEAEKAKLIDHIGACERILKTPLAFVFTIKVRRFILLYLLLLPLALVAKIGWATPVAFTFLTYSILSLDQIGEELQNPFSKNNLSHLPLDDISKTIHKNLEGLFHQTIHDDVVKIGANLNNLQDLTNKKSTLV